MARLQIEYPEELLEQTEQSREDLERLAREALLVRLYDLGRISSGKAAELLGIPRTAFLDLLGTYRVSLFDDTQDVGEAAVITLAQASNARLVILDDRRARHTARQLGLTVVGTLGVLLAAKQTGALPALKPVLDALIAQGRHISPKLHAEVLRAAGEDLTADREDSDNP